MTTTAPDTSRKSGGRTTSETIDWRSLVAEAEGANYPFFEHIAYEFSRKTFYEDDNAGHYNEPF